MGIDESKLTKKARDYRFLLEEKDDVIFLIQNEVQRLNGGVVTREFLERLSHKCGVGAPTLINWFFHDTKHPRYLSIKFVLDALDLELVAMRSNGSVVRGPRANVKLAKGLTRKKLVPKHSNGHGAHP